MNVVANFVTLPLATKNTFSAAALLCSKVLRLTELGMCIIIVVRNIYNFFQTQKSRDHYSFFYVPANVFCSKIDNFSVPRVDLYLFTMLADFFPTLGLVYRVSLNLRSFTEEFLLRTCPR